MVAVVAGAVVVGVAGTVATGRDEDGGEERQRHQWPHPSRWCHRDASADERVVCFHDFVLLSAAGLSSALRRPKPAQ